MTKSNERTSATMDTFAKYHQEFDSMYGDFQGNMDQCKGEATLNPASAKAAGKPALKGKFTYGGRRREEVTC